jgi:IS30 family transposase
MVQMGKANRWGLSAAQKRELWERWQRGQSSYEIARAYGKLSGSIYKVLSSRGGIEHRGRRRSRWALSLAEREEFSRGRRRSRWALSLAEREEISRGLADGRSLRAIASSLQRAPSTVSRKMGRHRGRTRYRATASDQRAWDHARRPKRCRLAVRRRLQQLVARKLSLDWSGVGDIRGCIQCVIAKP